MKKLTKKQIEERQTKLNIRRTMIEEFENFKKDYYAVERVATMNGEKEKLDYRGNLSKEEQDKILNTYENIKNLSDSEFFVIGTLIDNEKENGEHFKQSKYCHLNHYIKEDEMVINRLYGHEIKEIVKFAKRIGVERIHLFYGVCMGLILELVELNVKLSGKSTIKEDEIGIILDLEELILD